MADPARRTLFDVAWKAILRVVIAVALVALLIKLYQIVLLVLVAVILAVTLNPLVVWLERRRMPRAAGAVLVTGVLVAIVAAFLSATWSELTAQAQYATEHFGDLSEQVVARLPAWMRDSIASAAGGDVPSRVGAMAFRLAQSITAAIFVVLLGLILTVYFLIEASATRDWLMAYVPQRYRARVEATLVECRRAIFGYMAGNVATSIFAFVFVLIALSVLKVPAALLLAVAAGLCDFIPVLGFILSSVPAIVLGATVSPRTAIVVAVLYAAYHTAENYLIAPYVYGDRLKLSNVAVILAFAVGAELAGVIGALIALPIAAMYPTIERIWLREHLAEDTVREHQAIEHRKAG